MATPPTLPRSDSATTASDETAFDDSDIAPKIKLGIGSVSDVVFGLALSIGSVILIAKLPQSPQDLSFDILDFGFSFLIVIMAWLGYRRTVVTLPHETQGTLIVNIALLFCVSIEPFLFYVLVSSSTPFLEFASTVYAVDVGAMLFLLSAFNYLLLVEERTAHQRRVHPALIQRPGWTCLAGLW